jgi:hypothetical protein
MAIISFGDAKNAMCFLKIKQFMVKPVLCRCTTIEFFMSPAEVFYGIAACVALLYCSNCREQEKAGG